MKVRLFTHTDLDGVGCAVVGKQAFGNTLDVKFCGYNTINQKVVDFIKSGDAESYDAVFITDISVDDKTAKLIETTIKYKTMLIDHHNTALWLNRYDWAYVSDTEKPLIAEHRESVKASGTSLFYTYLVENGFLSSDNKQLLDFCEQVREYDTWEWSNIYNNELPNQLNTLMYTIGIFKFFERFSKNPDVILNSTEQTILDIEKARVENYIKQKSGELELREILGYNVGIVFADQYVSQLGNYLAVSNKNLDFIMLINMSGTISFRGIKDEIDLGEVAKHFGGGGHPKASGGSLSYECKMAVIDELIKSVS